MSVGAHRANMVDEARLNSWISAGFVKQVFWHQTLEASLCVVHRCLRCFRTPKDNFMWHHAGRRRKPLILAKNDHKGRRDSCECELSRMVCFAGLRGRTLEACAEMVG